MVLNIWASWCGPCREEMPVLARLSRESGARGVKFLGLNSRDQEGPANELARVAGITYGSVADSDGALGLRLRGIVPVSGVPSTVVIDERGRVAARIIGPADYRALRTLIAFAGQERERGG